MDGEGEGAGLGWPPGISGVVDGRTAAVGACAGAGVARASGGEAPVGDFRAEIGRFVGSVPGEGDGAAVTVVGSGAARAGAGGAIIGFWVGAGDCDGVAGLAAGRVGEAVCAGWRTAGGVGTGAF